MVTLPPEFIATKYPGYFFNTHDEKLYSIKVDGVLKPLKFYRANIFNKWTNTEGGYCISHKGESKPMTIESLRRLADNVKVNTEVPVRKS